MDYKQELIKFSQLNSRSLLLNVLTIINSFNKTGEFATICLLSFD